MNKLKGLFFQNPGTRSLLKNSSKKRSKHSFISIQELTFLPNYWLNFSHGVHNQIKRVEIMIWFGKDLFSSSPDKVFNQSSRKVFESDSSWFSTFTSPWQHSFFYHHLSIEISTFCETFRCQLFQQIVHQDSDSPKLLGKVLLSCFLFKIQLVFSFTTSLVSSIIESV